MNDNILVTADEVALLEKAIVKIEAGWTRGKMTRREGGKVRYCLVGALTAVAPFETRRRLERLIQQTLDITSDKHIVAWNDEPRRKKSEVLALMREALDEGKNQLAGVA